MSNATVLGLIIGLGLWIFNQGPCRSTSIGAVRRRWADIGGNVTVLVACCRVEGAALAVAGVPNAKKKTLSHPEKSERCKSSESCLWREMWWINGLLFLIFVYCLPLEEILSGSSSSHSADAGSARLIDWMRAARYSKHPRSKAARQRAVSSLTR